MLRLGLKAGAVLFGWSVVSMLLTGVLTSGLTAIGSWLATGIFWGLVFGCMPGILMLMTRNSPRFINPPRWQLRLVVSVVTVLVLSAGYELLVMGIHHTFSQLGMAMLRAQLWGLLGWYVIAPMWHNRRHPLLEASQ